MHASYAYHRLVSGLYLHVGYSITDRELLEGHSTMKFDLNSINRKLGALINGDPAEQVRCI